MREQIEEGILFIEKALEGVFLDLGSKRWL